MSRRRKKELSVQTFLMSNAMFAEWRNGGYINFERQVLCSFDEACAGADVVIESRFQSAEEAQKSMDREDRQLYIAGFYTFEEPACLTAGERSWIYWEYLPVEKDKTLVLRAALS